MSAKSDFWVPALILLRAYVRQVNEHGARLQLRRKEPPYLLVGTDLLGCRTQVEGDGRFIMEELADMRYRHSCSDGLAAYCLRATGRAEEEA